MTKKWSFRCKLPQFWKT